MFSAERPQNLIKSARPPFVAVRVPQKRDVMKYFKLTFPLLIAAAALLTPGAPLAAQSGGRGTSNLVITNSDGVSRSYFVNGKTVTVRGNGNRIRLTGYSSFVRVTGTNNVVMVDAARAISVSGRGNRVTWRRLANGIRPRISRTGTGNRVSRSR